MQCSERGMERVKLANLAEPGVLISLLFTKIFNNGDDFVAKMNQLPSNHHRILSVTARTVEETIDELESMLRAHGINKLTSRITVGFSKERREHLLAKMNDLRLANAELFRTFELSPSVVSEEQIMQAGLVNLWTILVDSKARGMRGFGRLDDEIASRVDDRIEALLRIIDGLT